MLRRPSKRVPLSVESLDLVLPSPMQHQVHAQLSGAKSGRDHSCRVGRARGSRTCRAAEMYRDRELLSWAENVWAAIGVFHSARMRLGNPVEMDEQWTLLLEGAHTLAESAAERATASLVWEQAMHDARVAGFGDDDPQVEAAREAREHIRESILVAVEAILETAAAAKEAAETKEHAEAVAAAVERRARGAQAAGEASERAVKLARALRKRRRSLEEFSGSVREMLEELDRTGGK